MGDTEIDAEDIMFGCFQHTRRFLKDPAYNTIGVTLQRENENNETGYILCDTRGVPRVVCFGGMKKTPEMNPGQRLRYFVYPTHAVNGWVSFKIYLRKNCRAKLKPVYEAANRSFEGLWTAPGKGISVRSPGVECHVLLKISQKPSDTENSLETFPPLCSPIRVGPQISQTQNGTSASTTKRNKLCVTCIPRSACSKWIKSAGTRTS